MESINWFEAGVMETSTTPVGRWDYKRRMISSAICLVVSFPPRSAVRAPAVLVPSTARSTAAASVSQPSEWRSNMAVDKIMPIGLAIPFPAISGA